MKRLLPLLLLAAACSGPPPAPAAIPREKAPKPPAPTKTPAGPKLSPPRVFDESLLTGREGLLENAGKAEVLDYTLGALNTDAAVVSAVTAFLADTADGKLEAEFLSPRWSSYLQDWAGLHQVKGEVRVGTSREQEGDLMVPFRTKDGTLRGWVVLERFEKGYRVTDAHSEAAEPRTVPFDPESPSS